MTWTPPLKRAPDKPAESWSTNDELLAQWVRELSLQRLAPSTKRSRESVVRTFLKMWGPVLATHLNERDIHQYIEAVSAKCPKLQYDPHRRERLLCKAGCDVTQCPMLDPAKVAARDYASCPGYRPIEPTTVSQYLAALATFYEWLEGKGAIASNPAARANRTYRRNNKAYFSRKAHTPGHYIPTTDEVRRILRVSPVYSATIWILCAKLFLRPHEAAKLSMSPTHFNMDAGYIVIPDAPEYGQKRIGNTRLYMDMELRRLLIRYLAWRNDHVKRDAAGNPITDNLLVTGYGQPWTPRSFDGGMNRCLRRALKRAKLPQSIADGLSAPFTPHSFRGFATSWARDHGAPDSALQILRGDSAPGAIDRYDSYVARLPDLFAKYGPILDV